MAVPPGVNRVLDAAHRVTVGVLAASALYFSMEIFRASWAIQDAKFQARQAGKGGGGSDQGSGGAAGQGGSS